MLNHPTDECLLQRRLHGMAKALAEQQQSPELQTMTFEERLALRLERAVTERYNRQTSRRLRRARLKEAETPHRGLLELFLESVVNAHQTKKLVAL